MINVVSQLVDIVKSQVNASTEPTVTSVSNLIDFLEHNISIGDIRQHNPPGFNLRGNLVSIVSPF